MATERANYTISKETSLSFEEAADTSTTSCQQCAHDGPMIVDHVQGGYVSQCSRCERWGPIGKTPEKARRLLMSLQGGMRSGVTNESEECQILVSQRMLRKRG